MYVRKFEGETLDAALQSVKKELGPDAIILKTVTNKGLKGAFKKGRVEITAAISEQSYTKKAKVDKVLSENQQSQFYQEPAANINQKINRYNDNTSRPSSTGGGYGQMGLNKVVSTVSKASQKIQSSLDDFLSDPEEEFRAVEESTSFTNEKTTGRYYDEPVVNTPQFEREVDTRSDHISGDIENLSARLQEQSRSQSHQIEVLEQKIFELTQRLSESPKEHDEPKNLHHLRNTLRSLGLNNKLVVSIIKKASFEFSTEELNDADLIYDFALREINGLITTAMPLFSEIEMADKPVVTVLVSEGATGQSAMTTKLAVLKEDVKVIKFRETESEVDTHDFTQKIFNLDVISVSSLSKLMSEARKSIEQGQSIILDLKLNFQEADETKKFLEILRRSFDHIEILTTINAINSEIYNRKILAKYNSFSNGVIISYVDQCLNFASLVNLNHEFNLLPLKFFGTGPTVPDDIEAATAERILAGMFEL